MFIWTDVSENKLVVIVIVIVIVIVLARLGDNQSVGWSVPVVSRVVMK